MGQFFHELLHFSPIASESVARYLLLIAGFLGLISLFRSKFIKIIFAVIWFLPPLRMIDVIKYIFGLQYALIGISIFIILLIHFVFYLNKNKPSIYKVLFRKSELYYIIFGLIAGGLFIYFAKSHAVRVENHYDLLDLRIFTDSFRIFTRTMMDLFLLESMNHSQAFIHT